MELKKKQKLFKKLLLVSFIFILLSSTASAFVGESTNYKVEGMFGGSGLVNDTVSYNVGVVVTNQQPTFENTSTNFYTRFGLYPFLKYECFRPNDNTEYTFGVDILSTDVTICQDTYNNVTFVIDQTVTSIDCDGSTFIGDGTSTFMTVEYSYFSMTRCNVTNYTYGVRTTDDSGLYYDNSFLNNTISNAYDGGSNNAWNTTKDCYSGFNIIGGLCKGGNYYDDYNGSDTNFDGIGNTFIPYEVSTNGNDYLPLTNIVQGVSDEFDFGLSLLFLGLAMIFLFIAFNLAEQHSVLKTLFIVTALFILIIGVNLLMQIAPSWVTGTEGQNVFELLSLASNSLIYMTIFVISYFVIFIIWGLLTDLNNKRPKNDGEIKG